MRVLGIVLVSIFAFIGLVFCLLIALGLYSFASLPTGEASLPEKMVLRLDVGEPFPEDPSPDIYSTYAFALTGREETPPLLQVVEALDRAAADPSVTGLLVRIQPGDLGMAQAQELRAAILRFRQSGKDTVAFAETFGEGDNGTIPYYVASAVDDIWLQPSGLVGMTGFSVRQPYLRGLLDQWGVAPEFETRKSYKNAVSFLTDDTQTDAEREALKAVVDGWLDQVVRGVVKERKISESDVRTLIDASPLVAPVAVNGGLVNFTGYRDQLIGALGLSFKDENKVPYDVVSTARYVRAYVEPPLGKTTRKIVFLNASGMIEVGDGQGASNGRTIDARALSDAIEEIVTDSSVAAIILRIDSPGGSYVGSDIIWRSIEKARETGMPVIASMGNVAASGGYFMAMGANRIVAQPGTLTGSIGVLSGKVSIQKLSADHHVVWGGVDAGRNAGMYSLSEPFDESGRERLRTIMDMIYQDFTAKAAKGRGLKPDEIEAAAQGRIWTGEDAKRMGLVDELGGLPEAIEAARREAGLAPGTPFRVVPYQKEPAPSTFFRVLANQIQRIQGILGLAETLQPAVREVEPFMQGLQTRKPGALVYTGPVPR